MSNVWEAMKKHEAEQAAEERAKETQAARKTEAESAPGAGGREESPFEASAAATATEAPVTEAAPGRSSEAQTPVVDTQPAAIPAESAREPAAVQTVMTRPAPPAVEAPKTLEETRVEPADYSELLMAHHDRGGPVTEEYRAVRTSLLAQNPDERFCYLITSAGAGEGKTITAANLAIVMAERIDRRTVLVDCDLRKHMLATYLSTPNEPGMVQLLRAEAALKQTIQPTAYPNLFFLPAGEAPEDEVAELIGRPELEETVAELRRQYDYVIFDTPPINVVSDAGMLGQAAGEALLVVRMHKTHRESVDKALRLLHAANVKPAGIVLTHRRFLIPNYLYRYS